MNPDLIAFSQLPENSKVWVYQADRQMSPEQEALIKQHLDHFLKEWNAHGTRLFAAGDVLLGRFVILAVDEVRAEASGCSIDSSIRMVKHAGEDAGIDFFNRLNIAFLENDLIRTIHFRDVKEAYEEDEINDGTIVFDNTVDTLGDLKERWMLPLKLSPARTALLS